MAAAPPSAPVMPAPGTIPRELLQPIVPAAVVFHQLPRYHSTRGCFSTSCRVKTCTRGRRFPSDAALPHAPTVVYHQIPCYRLQCQSLQHLQRLQLSHPRYRNMSIATVSPRQFCERFTMSVSIVFFLCHRITATTTNSSLKTVQNDHDSYRFKYLGSYCLHKIIS